MVFPRGRGRYLEPALGLLLALHGQHEGLAARQGEAQLVPLLAALLGDVDDVAEVQRELRVRGAVLDALVTLSVEGQQGGWRGRRVHRDKTG